MKAIICKGNGEPRDILSVAQIAEPPTPGPGEALVRLQASAVHPADYLAMRGFLPGEGFFRDGVPGIDGVGIVEALGDDAGSPSGVAVGSRVLIYPGRGIWAERIVVPVTTLITVPADIATTTASQLTTNGATAVMLLEAADAAMSSKTDATLLLTAAASGVARNIILLAAMRGQQVIGLVRRSDDATALADQFDNLHVVGANSADWQSTVRSHAGGPVTVVLDPIGGEIVSALLDLLADGGTLISYGALDPRPALVPAGAVTGRELTIRGQSVPRWVERTTSQARAAAFMSLFEMARRYPKHFETYRSFPLDEAVAALAAVESGPRRGAVLLSFDD